MTRTVFCQRLQSEAPGLEEPPYPGELGQRIFENISAEAWEQWLSLQTMLINEYRLNLIDPQSQAFLKKEMQKFLFEGEDIKLPGHSG